MDRDASTVCVKKERGERGEREREKEREKKIIIFTFGWAWQISLI